MSLTKQIAEVAIDMTHISIENYAHMLLDCLPRCAIHKHTHTLSLSLAFSRYFLARALSLTLTYALFASLFCSLTYTHTGRLMMALKHFASKFTSLAPVLIAPDVSVGLRVWQMSRLFASELVENETRQRFPMHCACFSLTPFAD